MIHIPDDDQWDPSTWPLPPQPADNEPIYLRDGGTIDTRPRCCYRVPGVCRGLAESADHRVHGDRPNRAPSNLISACGDGTVGCHGWKEAHPDEAEARGWTVSRHGRDTTRVPVLLYHAVYAALEPGWFLLGDDYSITPTSPPEGAPDAT